MRTLIYVLLLSIIGTPGLAAKFPERFVTKVDGIAIEADPADAEYVQALIVRLKQPGAAAAQDRQTFGIAELRAQREPVLNELATRLALEKPSPLMGEVFDKFSDNAGAIHDAMISGRPTHYTLWRKPDLVARLQDGQIIPGFRLDGDEVAVALNASFEAPARTPPDQLAAIIGKAWRRLVWPVKIGLDSPAADIEATFTALNEFRQAVAGAEVTSLMNVLHETVESTLIQRYLHSADRRWFCEGIANHLALEVVRKRVGNERARQYYDVDALLAHAGAGNFADLATWPVAESPEARHYASEINQANYVRATWVIERIVARHGPDLIPNWLREIGATPIDQAGMRTVKAAFRKLTGEDVNQYLEGPISR